MTTMWSPRDISTAAGMLFAATLIIVVDIRLSSFDIVADVIGGVVVLLAVLRVHRSAGEAGLARTALVILAIIALPVTVIETVATATGVIALLGFSQLLGALVLAGLLANLLSTSDPGLARRWQITYWLIAVLAVAPYLGGTLLGFVAGDVHVESPIVLGLAIVLAIPLVSLLHSLWITSTRPVPAPASLPSPSPL